MVWTRCLVIGLPSYCCAQILHYLVFCAVLTLLVPRYWVWGWVRFCHITHRLKRPSAEIL